MKKILQCVVFFLGFCVLHISAHEVPAHEEHGAPRINPFLEILKSENITNSNVLPVTKLDKYVTQLFQHLHCYDARETSTIPPQQTSGQCQASLCIRVTDLTTLASVNTSLYVTEKEFDRICLILLYYVTQIQTLCHTQVDMSNVTMKLVTNSLLKLAGVSEIVHSHLLGEDISRLLGTFKDFLIHDPKHEQDPKHEHGDEHDHEAGDGHEDHNHDTRQTKQGHDHDDADKGHDHDHEGHDHDHEGHDHDHEEEVQVIKKQCLSGDAVLYYMRENEAVDFDEIERLASVIVYFITMGYDVEYKCRILPNQWEFLSKLFTDFATAGNMSVSGLENLMTKLAINPEIDPHAEHGHGDVHIHRKRSVQESQVAASSTEGNHFDVSVRMKRQAADQASIKKCYTAKQLMVINDSPNGVDQVSFQQLCPSLISQKLYADCIPKEEKIKSKSTEAERYGYSTIATAIICLCSVFGVIFIPCVSQKVYDILMSTFVGLAVGTLFADAILHLIPMTLGVHSHSGHDHEHYHGGGIEVEAYILFGLAIMAGLYFFYILETVMSRFGGHSHSHGPNDSDMVMYPNTHTKSPTFEEDAEPPKEKSGKNYVVHADSPGMLPDQKPSNKTCGLTPIALMIIIGDGIHNFADGLAIGASFTSSISAGIATSIAVFCHELPHELGDFAVLLQSGLSFKKAVILNLASALTAFAGLYVSLSVSHGEEAQRWIFAVTSGMFLYIALVDLLPQLIKTTGTLTFTLNNIGILIGFAIMLVIAIFEGHIKV